MSNTFARLLEAWAEKARQPESTTPHNACEARGYCGPFVNQSYFNSLETWEGFGMCVECGRVVPVPRGDRSFERLDRWMKDGLRTEALRIAV